MITLLLLTLILCGGDPPYRALPPPKLAFIINIVYIMKTVEHLKQEIYEQAMSSGYFKSMQAQLKTYVFDLIEKQYNSGKSKTGFQYEHPLLPKLRKFPLTSLCMDLIQEFLQSFKFKHTLNVFKKEINRSQNISRGLLAEQFRIQIKNPEAKAVLLSLVEQMASGEVGAFRQVTKSNMTEKKAQQPIRDNYFMGQTKKPSQPAPNIPKQPIPEPQRIEKPSFQNSSGNVSSSSVASEQKANSQSNNESKQNISANSAAAPNADASVASNVISNDKSGDSKTQKQGKKQKQAKKKIEKEKPPEGATDLLGDVMKKFEGITKVSKDQEKKEIFQSKRAFSQEREKKVTDPSESGVNKIRGISAGKPMSSLMSKFMPQAVQPPKNDSYIDEQMDEFQQSKDSTRRNPLFSSSESGFDKSGFDCSVDSNSIEQYQYIQRARKPFKKV